MLVLSRVLFFVSLVFIVKADAATQAQISAPERPIIARLVIDSAIAPVTDEYLKSGLEQAKILKAAAVVVELDTPGGLMESTRLMVERILSSSIPVIMYVAPSGARAASAGVFLTLASHVAVMAPTTHIGAAHPVSLFGSDVESDMKKKVENDAAAWARSLAQTHGRNVEFAEKAVRESISYSSEEALKSRVVDFIAADLDELIAKVDGTQVMVSGEAKVLHLKNADVIDVQMTGKQKIVSFLSNPNLLYLLMIIGLLGLFLEFQFPGLILPGLIGGICLITVFGVQVLPVSWLGAILILAAVSLLVAEIYVTSLGLLTVGGLGLFVLGSYLLFEVPGSMLRVEPLMIWVFSAFIAAVFAAVGWKIVRTRRQGATSGVDAMKGERVTVYKAIPKDGHGLVKLQGSFWSAYCDEDVAKDEEVVVDRVVGTKVYVKRIRKEGE